jgi:hypothetical protein
VSTADSQKHLTTLIASNGVQTTQNSNSQIANCEKYPTRYFEGALVSQNQTNCFLYMNKPIAVALLVVGIVLLIFGYNASHSASSTLSRVFTGSPTNKAMWLIIGGIIATILGVFGLSRGSK